LKKSAQTFIEIRVAEYLTIEYALTKVL
jgi:hypothetical protein